MIDSNAVEMLLFAALLAAMIFVLTAIVLLILDPKSYHKLKTDDRKAATSKHRKDLT